MFQMASIEFIILPLIKKIYSEKCNGNETRRISEMEIILEFWVNICYGRNTTLPEIMAG